MLHSAMKKVSSYQQSVFYCSYYFSVSISPLLPVFPVKNFASKSTTN